MKITSVSTIVYGQQLAGGQAPKFAGVVRASFETVLVRIDTDAGVTGWGEVFAHRFWQVSKQVVDSVVAPLCIGADPRDIGALMGRLSKANYGYGGRGGLQMFALSGVDTALWDIAGKLAGKPLHRLLGDGGVGMADVPVYASLLRYGDTATVVAHCEQALARGYRKIKVHETGWSEIAEPQKLLRARTGEGLMVDVMAPWSAEEAVDQAHRLRDLDLAFVEEPVWPPEDFAALAPVRAAGVPVAVGENVPTPGDFVRLMASGNADVIQPSVTKVGGVSAMRDILRHAAGVGARVVPHSAYFGPGLIATAHLVAALSPTPLFERLYCDLTESPFGDWYVPVEGRLSLPTGPGLGIDPDPAVLERCRVA